MTSSLAIARAARTRWAPASRTSLGRDPSPPGARFGYPRRMPKESAGLLMYRRRGELEVLLVHPGGPLWAGKEDGAWTIPKGEIGPGEDPLAAARREFAEETGFASAPPFLPLTPIRQRSGKLVRAWAFAGDCAPEQLRSNTFTMEWPPRSGRHAEFPEIDRAAFFTLAAARPRINPAQLALLEELARRLPSP